MEDNFKFGKIDELIRYLLSGAYFYGINAYYGTKFYSDFLKNQSIPLITIFCLVIGMIAYFVFRSLLNPLIFHRTSDWFNSQSARNYLRRKGLKKWKDRNDIWQIFQTFHKDEFKREFKIWLASIHSLFIMSIMSILTPFQELIDQTHLNCDLMFNIKNAIFTHYGLLGLSLILLFSGYFSQRHLEIRLFKILKIKGIGNLDNTVNSYKLE